MKYLADSDWLIDMFGGSAATAELINVLRDDGVGISIITVGEIYEGAFGSAASDFQLARHRRAQRRFPVIGLTEPVMETFARTRALLRRQGQMIGDLDLLIAATAISLDLTPITRNRRHFERVPVLVHYENN